MKLLIKQMGFQLNYSQKLIIKDIISKKDENILFMLLENLHVEILDKRIRI